MTDMPLLSGRDFERFVKAALDLGCSRGLIHAGRYGVQGVMRPTEKGGRPEWQPMRSLPDFEGVVAGGRQFVLDAKVCSGASLELRASHVAERQLDHLVERGRMGAVAFLLCHWNGRQLKTRSETPATYAIPVAPDLPLWREFSAAERRVINRRDAELHGELVRWSIPIGRRTLLPEVVEWVLARQPQTQEAPRWVK